MAAYRYAFSAMGSPCEVQVDTPDPAVAHHLGALAEREAKRIEHKFSRYRDDSVIAAINASQGSPVIVDDETALLLDYAAQCHALSDGRFDVTSGVLRRLWRFDGSDRLPSANAVAELRTAIGWHQVAWHGGAITLPPGAEIDFGGLGKEYAVDRAVQLIRLESNAPTLVNFGGDLAVTGTKRDGAPWRVLIEAIDAADAAAWIEIDRGAITTSGDARRFLLKDGVRYSHILDPRTGWPVTGAPRAVTVAASSCLEAGILSTLAMLHGEEAERFLGAEGAQAWVSR